MFQYALGRRLSVDHNTNLELDITAFRHDPLRSYRLYSYQLCKHSVREDISSSPITPSWFQRVRNRFLRSNLRYVEPHFYYDENVLRLKNCFLDGYWQSEKYFSSIRSILLKEFTPRYSLRQDALSVVSLIAGCEAVSVHVRRGDYVNNPSAYAFHGLVDVEWYASAIRYIESRVSDPQFFFFSDDIAWVRERFPKRSDFHFVDASPDGLEHEDIFMMSSCKHQIIANSSFSWWAAWLNNNDQKIVIAPQRWFQKGGPNTRDLLPDSWVRL